MGDLLLLSFYIPASTIALCFCVFFFIFYEEVYLEALTGRYFRESIYDGAMSILTWLFTGLGLSFPVSLLFMG